MIPRSQHFGDRAPFPCDRSGIVRVFEQTILERFVVTARSRAHHAGKQPNASVAQQQRRRLSARQDDIAHRALLYGASSEERRAGKERVSPCRCWWSPTTSKKKKQNVQ